jgi:hypothetical protein
VDEVTAMQQADFRAASYWMTTRDYLPGPPLAGDIEVDVAIIGGGFTGLSAAHHLTEVFFVNRRTIPWPPEPIRSLAAAAIRGYMRWEDKRFDPAT